MEYTNYAYDLYLIKTSGVPIFAGCCASAYCIDNPKEHMLHSGLLIALYSYSKQSFVHSTLKTITFDDRQINFNIDEEKGVMIVMIHPYHVEQFEIQTQLDKAYAVFLNDFEHLLKEDVYDESLFEQYKAELLKIGIIPEDIHSILDAQLSAEEMILKKLHIPGLPPRKV